MVVLGRVSAIKQAPLDLTELCPRGCHAEGGMRLSGRLCCLKLGLGHSHDHSAILETWHRRPRKLSRQSDRD